MGRQTVLRCVTTQLAATCVSAMIAIPLTSTNTLALVRKLTQVRHTFLCSTQSDLGLLAFALCCIVDFGPCLLVCPGSSLGRALCIDCRVSWVRVPPRAAHFFFEKSVVLGVVELFALHLCCLSPHYDLYTCICTNRKPVTHCFFVAYRIEDLSTYYVPIKYIVDKPYKRHYNYSMHIYINNFGFLTCRYR